jgi:conserved repeat domain
VRNVTLGTAAGTSNTARPGDVLEYVVTYTNSGAGTLSAIVVTDATPAFTTFQGASCGAPLPGNITACSVTSQPAVNASGSVVWTLTGSLLSGGSGTVLYTVRVNP